MKTSNIFKKYSAFASVFFNPTTFFKAFRHVLGNESAQKRIYQNERITGGELANIVTFKSAGLFNFFVISLKMMNDRTKE